MTLAGYERVSLLKVDIEGGERELFSTDVEQWIGKIDNIVIELHGKQAEEVFFEAIASENFSVSTCDELTVCKRL
jgi:hypothetical protein